ncbi:MAG: hypothetical protein ABEJ56_03490 [Candidatus Nanohaloarchaea archaeon]
MEIVVTENAVRDIAELPGEVEDTFFSAKKTAEKNLNLGASPDQALEKYLSGGMHPILQETLGADYRAWFIEGGRANKMLGRNEFDEDKLYCFRVLTAKEAHKIEDGSRNARAILQFENHRFSSLRNCYAVS